jgi:iron complex transport system substrate-binding protein
MKTSVLFILSISLFLTSCGNGNKNENDAEILQHGNIRYATGFDIKKYANYVEVTVHNPWDSTNILRKYVLVEKDKALPPDLPAGVLIRTPLENVAVTSSIYCTILQELDMLKIISGVCEPQYVIIDYISKGIENGTIADLGQTGSPDIEKIILTNPEVIMIAPIQGASYGAIEKTHIPLIETPDYMESTPLGRAEWIKFYAVFLGKEEMADSLFSEIERQYNKIKEKTSHTSVRPTVFNDVRYGNVWYVPGGKSYMANLMKDAGASYLWEDNPATGSIPLSYEMVLEKAETAQFWLIKYNNKFAGLTYENLKKEFKPYSYFDAFRNKNIYGCNTGIVTYYEDLPVHPEYILQDMAAIFHPELFPEYQPKYYKKLESK